MTSITALKHSFNYFSKARRTTGANEAMNLTPDEVRDLVVTTRREVVSLSGYSDAEYEDPPAMRRSVARVLDELDPDHTLINSGATASGIGACYAIAQRRGFITTGIVSMQAKIKKVAWSPYVDFLLFVTDSSWGGSVAGTRTQSPTSEAMVTSSQVLVAIGGGDIARDELLAAEDLGKRTRIIAADLNYQLARKNAIRTGAPLPSDFGGAVRL